MAKNSYFIIGLVALVLAFALVSGVVLFQAVQAEQAQYSGSAVRDLAEANAIGLIAGRLQEGVTWDDIEAFEGRLAGASSNDDFLFGGVSNFDIIEVDEFIANASTTVKGGPEGTATTTILGVDHVWVRKSFDDATTTTFAFQNPFGATSTAILHRYITTGVATSSHQVRIGTSTTASGVPSATIASTAEQRGTAAAPTAGSISTSTNYVIVGGLTYPGTASTNGFISSGGIAQQQILIGPTEYIVGAVTTCATAYGVALDLEGCDQAFTDGSNTYDGYYILEFISR